MIIPEDIAQQNQLPGQINGVDLKEGVDTIEGQGIRALADYSNNATLAQLKATFSGQHFGDFIAVEFVKAARNAHSAEDIAVRLARGLRYDLGKSTDPTYSFRLRDFLQAILSLLRDRNSDEFSQQMRNTLNHHLYNEALITFGKQNKIGFNEKPKAEETITKFREMDVLPQPMANPKDWLLMQEYSDSYFNQAFSSADKLLKNIEQRLDNLHGVINGSHVLQLDPRVTDAEKNNLRRFLADAVIILISRVPGLKAGTVNTLTDQNAAHLRIVDPGDDIPNGAGVLADLADHLSLAGVNFLKNRFPVIRNWLEDYRQEQEASARGIDRQLAFLEKQTDPLPGTIGYELASSMSRLERGLQARPVDVEGIDALRITISSQIEEFATGDFIREAIDAGDNDAQSIKTTIGQLKDGSDQTIWYKILTVHNYRYFPHKLAEARKLKPFYLNQVFNVEQTLTSLQKRNEKVITQLRKIDTWQDRLDEVPDLLAEVKERDAEQFGDFYHYLPGFTENVNVPDNLVQQVNSAVAEKIKDVFDPDSNRRVCLGYIYELMGLVKFDKGSVNFALLSKQVLTSFPPEGNLTRVPGYNDEAYAKLVLKRLIWIILHGEGNVTPFQSVLLAYAGINGPFNQIIPAETSYSGLDSPQANLGKLETVRGWVSNPQERGRVEKSTYQMMRMAIMKYRSLTALVRPGDFNEGWNGFSGTDLDLARPEDVKMLVDGYNQNKTSILAIINELSDEAKGGSMITSLLDPDKDDIGVWLVSSLRDVLYLTRQQILVVLRQSEKEALLLEVNLHLDDAGRWNALLAELKGKINAELYAFLNGVAADAQNWMGGAWHIPDIPDVPVSPTPPPRVPPPAPPIGGNAGDTQFIRPGSSADTPVVTIPPVPTSTTDTDWDELGVRIGMTQPDLSNPDVLLAELAKIATFEPPLTPRDMATSQPEGDDFVLEFTENRVVTLAKPKVRLENVGKVKIQTEPEIKIMKLESLAPDYLDVLLNDLVEAGEDHEVSGFSWLELKEDQMIFGWDLNEGDSPNLQNVRVSLLPEYLQVFDRANGVPNRLVIATKEQPFNWTLIFPAANPLLVEKSSFLIDTVRVDGNVVGIDGAGGEVLAVNMIEPSGHSKVLRLRDLPEENIEHTSALVDTAGTSTEPITPPSDPDEPVEAGAEVVAAVAVPETVENPDRGELIEMVSKAEHVRLTLKNGRGTGYVTFVSDTPSKFNLAQDALNTDEKLVLSSWQQSQMKEAGERIEKEDKTLADKLFAERTGFGDGFETSILAFPLDAADEEVLRKLSVQFNARDPQYLLRVKVHDPLNRHYDISGRATADYIYTVFPASVWQELQPLLGKQPNGSTFDNFDLFVRLVIGEENFVDELAALTDGKLFYHPTKQLEVVDLTASPGDEATPIQPLAPTSPPTEPPPAPTETVSSPEHKAYPKKSESGSYSLFYNLAAYRKYLQDNGLTEKILRTPDDVRPMINGTYTIVKGNGNWWALCNYLMNKLRTSNDSVEDMLILPKLREAVNPRNSEFDLSGVKLALIEITKIMQQNAEAAVRELLFGISNTNNAPPPLRVTRQTLSNIQVVIDHLRKLLKYFETQRLSDVDSEALRDQRNQLAFFSKPPVVKNLPAPVNDNTDWVDDWDAHLTGRMVTQSTKFIGRMGSEINLLQQDLINSINVSLPPNDKITNLTRIKLLKSIYYSLSVLGFNDVWPNLTKLTEKTIKERKRKLLLKFAEDHKPKGTKEKQQAINAAAEVLEKLIIGMESI